MDDVIQADGGSAPDTPAANAAGVSGASKKQQRIADIVKEQIRGPLRDELVRELETRLEQLEALALARIAEGRDAAGAPDGRASRAIPPGGGAPPADLRAEYERRLDGVRPGDLAAVMEVKREFRKRGLEVY